MWFLNGPLGRFTNLVLAPFRAVSPWISLSVIALVTSVGILLVFRATSDQGALRQVKARIVAGILEIRLFRDDPRSIFRSQAAILRESLAYFRLSLRPMAWVILPVMLLVAQLQFRYAYEAPEPGQRTIVRVQLADHVALDRPGEELVLEVPEGIRVETPLLYVPARGQALWGVSVTEAGQYRLRVRVGNRRVEKHLAAVAELGRRSPRRPSPAVLDQLVYPAEPPVPTGGPVQWIEIDYPEARLDLWGLSIHWMVAFFALTIIFAFGLQRPLRVTI